MSHIDLAAFFADLSAQWKDWEGEKESHSLEDDFALFMHVRWSRARHAASDAQIGIV